MNYEEFRKTLNNMMLNAIDVHLMTPNTTTIFVKNDVEKKKFQNFIEEHKYFVSRNREYSIKIYGVDL